MNTMTEQQAGVEWGGRLDDDCDTPELEHDSRGWPILLDPCDGLCPDGFRRPCIVPGGHEGYHRDIAGNRWLDDGLNDHP